MNNRTNTRTPLYYEWIDGHFVIGSECHGDEISVLLVGHPDMPAVVPHDA